MQQRLLLLIFAAFTTGHMKGVPVEKEQPRVSLKLLAHRMPHESLPTVKKKESKPPAPYEHIRICLETICAHAQENTHLFRIEIKQIRRKLNPALYTTDDQELCEDDLDYNFRILLEDFIVDLQSNPHITAGEAEAMRTSIMHLYYVTVPCKSDEPYYIEMHRPFKYPLCSLLLSTLEAKLLSSFSYSKQERHGCTHYHQSLIDQSLNNLINFCNSYDILLEEEAKSAIDAHLAFSIPKLLSSIESQSKCSIASDCIPYLHDTVYLVGKIIQKPLITGIVSYATYKLLASVLPQNQDAQQHNGQQISPDTMIKLFTAVTVLLGQALPYLFDQGLRTTHRSTYGHNNPVPRAPVHGPRSGWTS